VQLLPALVFAATFGFFFLDKSREARTVLRSTRGVVTIAVIVLGYAAVAVVLRRLVRWTWVPPVVLAGAVLGLAAWLVRPYYVDDTANRELVTGPVVDAADAPTTTQPEAAEEPPVAPPSSPPPPAEPVRISTGTLVGIDHSASGTVSLISTPDGGLVLRFERFEVSGAPDPQLYLVPGDDVRNPGGVHLGRMPGNQGDVLDIQVPAGTDAGPGWTVLIWCGQFAVPIANATQAAT
jgi:hypothetical protein